MSKISFQFGRTASVCALSAALVLIMAGCESKPQPAPVTQAAVEKYSTTTTLQGLVTGDAGAVKSGIVKAISDKGDVLASVELGSNSRYNLELPGGTILPLLLTYYPEGDAGEAQRMSVAVVHATLSKYDINPSSTRIAKKAKQLGGYTHKNLVRAAEETGIVPADNKTTAGFRGDPTTQYGGWH